MDFFQQRHVGDVSAESAVDLLQRSPQSPHFCIPRMELFKEQIGSLNLNFQCVEDGGPAFRANMGKITKTAALHNELPVGENLFGGHYVFPAFPFAIFRCASSTFVLFA